MTLFRWGAAAAVALAAATTVLVAPSAMAHDGRGLTAVGLTSDGNQIVRFSTDDPTKVEQVGVVSGYVAPPPIPPMPPMFPNPIPRPADTVLVGIDYRVQNGKLYGVGNRGGIYLIDDQTAALTFVGRLSVALSGRFFGVDFNPAAGPNGALRIVSSTGQNLRQPFGAGDAPAGATVADTALNKGNPPAAATGVSGAAYTNNDLDATTATQLFDIDTTDDRLVLQNPPNAGTLVGIGEVGSLGKIGAYSGFDIFSTVENGVTVDNDAFAIVVDDNDLLLLAIDLSDGSAEDRGRFFRPIVDLAIALDQ